MVCAACCCLALVLAVMRFYNILEFFYCFCPFLFFFKYFFLKSGIDKSMEWSMLPACPGLVCFLDRGSTEGINSLKILCLRFMFSVNVSGLILWFLDSCKLIGALSPVNHKGLHQG